MSSRPDFNWLPRSALVISSRPSSIFGYRSINLRISGTESMAPMPAGNPTVTSPSGAAAMSCPIDWTESNI